MNESVKIDYLGWSGFSIEQKSGPKIFIDPPKGTSFEGEKIIILITHAHPEHLGGTLDHIRSTGCEKPTIIIASATVCAFFKKQCLNKHVEFITAQPLETLTAVKDCQITPFEWTHMPLLPPGFNAAIRHIWQIIKGYKHTLNILKMSLKGPIGAGTMLGYTLKLADQNIIIYGEGLHRHCKVEDVTKIGAIAPAATILVASEPEDINELPGLIYASGAFQAILYEPHRPWRDLFGLPRINLRSLQKQVADMGIHARIAK